MKARLPLEYTVLQQARFFGIEKFGIFVKDNSGKWTVKPRFAEKVSRFVANCKKAGITELSEGGLTPDQYQAEWEAIFKDGVVPSKAVGATVTLLHPFVDDYPAKGARTLVDGTPGYSDFSYNWLCFYGTPMVATIDLGSATPMHNISLHFLDDPRHWIFQPAHLKIETSIDGQQYTTLVSTPCALGDEHYEVSRKLYAAKVTGSCRYIRIIADSQPALPEWRYRDGKKPMLACDEVYVD
ncbi:MAG: hypothetical protein EBZ77_08360 [Chitinophagia bacterium]|nr:hypothetical protein [Chitinophagia bacterium]